MLGVKLPEPKRVKIRSKDLAKAAKEVGRFGENVGDLTTELRRAREGLANGNGGHNSPIEVLLKGLDPSTLSMPWERSSCKTALSRIGWLPRLPAQPLAMQEVGG